MFQVLLFLLTAIVAGVLSFWAVDREPPINLHGVKAANPLVEPEGRMIIVWDVERNRQCRVHIQQMLFDSHKIRFHIADEDYVIDPGPVGRDVFGVAVSIPRSMSAGPARYRAIRSYVCNPIHNLFPVVVIGPDVPFEVKR